MTQICEQNVKTNYWPAQTAVNDGDKVPSEHLQPNVEAAQEQAAYDLTITKLVVRVETAPGTGSKRRFTVRKNRTDTNLSITLSDSQTTGSVSGSASFGTTYFDYISIKEELIEGSVESAFSLGMVAETSTDRQPMIYGGKDSTANYPVAGGTLVYNTILGNTGSAWRASLSADRMKGMISSDGVFKNLRCLLAEAPFPGEAAKGYLFELQKFSADNSYESSGLDFSILGDNVTGEEDVASYSVEAGKTIILNSSITHGGWTGSFADFVTDFIPTNPGERIITTNVGGADNTTYFYPAAGIGVNAYAGTVENFIVMPTSGTIKNFYVNGRGLAAHVDEPLTVTVRKDGVNTALAVTITNPDTEDQNTSDSFTVVEGDLISVSTFSLDYNWGSVGLIVGFTFVSDNVLETPIFLTSSYEEPSIDDAGEVCREDTSSEVLTISCGYVGEVATSVANLDHLEGETVAILANGEVLDQQVVSDGAVVLGGNYSVVHVGLPYNSDLETLNINFDRELGSIQGSQVKIGNAMFRLRDSRGGWIGPDSDNLYEAFTQQSLRESSGQDLEDIELFTGDVRQPLGSEYKNGGRVFFRQVDPLPVTIGAIVPEVAVGGPAR